MYKSASVLGRDGLLLSGLVLLLAFARASAYLPYTTYCWSQLTRTEFPSLLLILFTVVLDLSIAVLLFLWVQEIRRGSRQRIRLLRVLCLLFPVWCLVSSVLLHSGPDLIHFRCESFPAPDTFNDMPLMGFVKYFFLGLLFVIVSLYSLWIAWRLRAKRIQLLFNEH